MKRGQRGVHVPLRYVRSEWLSVDAEFMDAHTSNEDEKAQRASMNSAMCLGGWTREITRRVFVADVFQFQAMTALTPIERPGIVYTHVMQRPTLHSSSHRAASGDELALWKEFVA